MSGTIFMTVWSSGEDSFSIPGLFTQVPSRRYTHRRNPKMYANGSQSYGLSIPYIISLIRGTTDAPDIGSIYYTSGANSSGPRGPNIVPIS